MQAKKVVIVGGGFGGLYTLVELAKLTKHFVVRPEITLISKENYFLFTPLLHEVATGSMNVHNVTQPIREITAKLGAEFMLGEVSSVDTEKKVVRLSPVIARSEATRQSIQDSEAWIASQSLAMTEPGLEIPFDYLVVATGATTRLGDLPREHVFMLKTLNEARALKNHIISCFEQASGSVTAEEKKRLLTFVVIGGGPTGVELAAELQEFICGTLRNTYPHLSQADLSTVLVHGEDQLLPAYSDHIRFKVTNELRKRAGVTLKMRTKVTQVTAKGVTLSTDEFVPTATAILVAGVEPNSLGFTPPIQTTTHGRVLVNEFLQSAEKNVFVVGDYSAAVSNGKPVPMTAQAATAMAALAAKNIAAALSGTALLPFVYHERGQLVSLGRWLAAAEVYGIPLFGHLAWWLWRTIYASKLIGFKNRLRVVLDWTIDIFYPRSTSRI